MKPIKWIVILLLVYVGIVAVFESLLGYFQPQNERTLVLTSFDGDGTPHPRVLARLESRDTLYVAANHWPRGWYRQALDNPGVQATIDGETRHYLAQPVTSTEYQRVNADNPLGLGFRILTGFPPRRFLRLEPAPAD